MEVQLAETLTYPSQSYAKSFFATLPTDARFTQTSYHKFMPTTSIDGPQLEFNLEKFEGPNVYLIQDSLLEVRIKIFDISTKAVPVKTIDVAPRNNILHTLFDKVSLYINDVLVTVDPSNYAYKAYILNT